MKRLLMLTAALACGAALADPATTLAPTSLRAQPFADAAVTASLPGEAAVEIVSRQGGWYQVKTASGNGWVRLSSLRLPAEATRGTTAVAYIGSGRASATGAVATTGVRGLSEADIANAQPNYAALDQLGNYAATAPTATDFAAQGGLKSTQVADLPETAP
jgi:hypothetical protein